MLRLNPAYLFAGLFCCLLISTTAQGRSIVRIDTNLGKIDVELYDEAAPITVANFLRYIANGSYDGTFISRSISNFVIQGGGYRNVQGLIVRLPSLDPILNEFSPSRSNLRGTIAMAKLENNPNSATNEWFFNLADNSTNLDSQNGGFTVFGHVMGNDMAIVDAIAALETWDLGNFSPQNANALINVPLYNYALPEIFSPEQHLVRVIQARRIITLTPVSPTSVSSIELIANPSPSDAPAGITFDEGFFKFQINGLTPGGSTMVALEMPAGYIPNTYYMYGPTPENPTPHWYEFKFNGRTGAEFFGNNFVVLNFIDGERGDADLVANGQITDPGAPGIDPTAAPTPLSSSSGGCTLTTANGIPSVPMEYGLFALLFIAYRAGRKTNQQQSTPCIAISSP